MSYIIDRKMRQLDGRLIDPFDLQAKDFNPKEYVHSLSLLNRFTGHSKYPYSVMQHTFNIIRHLIDRGYGELETQVLRAAMLHDFAEVWSNDVSSPFKTECKDYKAACKGIQTRIECIANGEPFDGWVHEIVDEVDKSIYKAERDALQYVLPHEQGMGDDRPDLDFSMCVFGEADWRAVRDTGFSMWNHLFKEMPIVSYNPTREGLQ